jgi:ribosomal protein L24E
MMFVRNDGKSFRFCRYDMASSYTIPIAVGGSDV